MKFITLPADANNNSRVIPVDQITSYYAGGNGTVVVTTGAVAHTYTTSSASDSDAGRMIQQIAFALDTTSDGGTVIYDAPERVTGLTASATAPNIISVSWNSHNCNCRYVLRRSLVSGSGYTDVYSGVGTSVDDYAPAGSTYYYTVVAINVGGESPASTEVSAYSYAESVSIVSASPSIVDRYNGGTEVTIYGYGFNSPMLAGAVVQMDPNGDGQDYVNCVVNFFTDTSIQFVSVPCTQQDINVRIYLAPNEIALGEDLLDAL